MWLCERCHLGVLETEAEGLADYYDRDYRELHGPTIGVRSSYAEIFDSYVEYQGPRVSMLRERLHSGVKLLEVGCSTGHFLYNVRGLVGEVVGVDFDREAAAFASERCDCVTFGGDLRDSPFEKASFDVVCAMQVMEHVADPIAFATLLGEYVRPGGTVYVEVPNLLDPLLSIYGEPSYRPFYFHEAHLFYMTEHSLAAIMRRAGFTGDVCFLQDYNLINHLHWLIAHSAQGSNHPGMGRPRLPLEGDRAEAIKGDLEAWLDEVDDQYRQLLSRHGVTDNVCFLSGPAY